MKKYVCLFLITVVFCAVLGCTLAEPMVFEDAGLTIPNPIDMDKLQGVLMPASEGDLYHDPNIYLVTFSYFAMPENEFYEIFEKDYDQLTQDEIDHFRARQGLAGSVLVTTTDFDTSLEKIGDYAMLLSKSPDRRAQIGSSGGYDYYYVLPEDSVEQTFIDAIDQKYAEELIEVEKGILASLATAQFNKPVDENRDAYGNKLEFVGYDLHGNQLSSKELFEGNEYTLVNLWGTWCGNCILEMEDLAQIHERLRAKGCGVVGIQVEMSEIDADIIAEALDIFEQYGVTYPNVVGDSDNMKFLDTVDALPTTYFVDREGNIVTYPIVGANVEQYEPTIDALLAGQKTEGVKSNSGAAANNGNAYNVYVYSNDGPVQGVAVQFCDESTCNLGKTDAEGKATFEVPEGHSYDVHILKVPEGYAKDTATYHMLDVYSDLYVSLKRE